MIKRSPKDLFKKRPFLKGLFLIIALFFGGYVLAAYAADLPEGIMAKNGPNNIPIDENQIIEMNKSLKNVIDDNQGLLTKNNELADDVEKLKMENSSMKERLEVLKKDRDEVVGNYTKVKKENRTFTQERDELAKNIKNLQTQNERSYQEKEFLEKELAIKNRYGDKEELPQEQREVSLDAGDGSADIEQREEKTLELLMKIDAFTEQDEDLKLDAAKAHYNIGNIYFQKGEYEIAAREYYQAVALMPDDPDSHYNLAYVSGEFLNDYPTALKHYQMYLYLNPNAKDIELVREKIVSANLHIRNSIDSPIDQ